MTTQAPGERQGKLSGSVVSVSGYLAPAILFWLGSHYLALLSGELPVFDPTDSEIGIWETGNLLLRAGAIALVIWSAIILAFHQRLGLSKWFAFVVVASALSITIVVAVIVWFATLPPLAV